MNLVPILLPSTKISLFKSSESALRESIISNDIKQVKKLLERDETIVNRDISEGDSHVRQSIKSRVPLSDILDGSHWLCTVTLYL